MIEPAKELEELADIFDVLQSDADWCGSCSACGLKLARAILAAGYRRDALLAAESEGR